MAPASCKNANRQSARDSECRVVTSSLVFFACGEICKFKRAFEEWTAPLKDFHFVLYVSVEGSGSVIGLSMFLGAPLQAGGALSS